LRVYVEAALDFPEEEIDFLSDKALSRRIDDLRKTFDSTEHIIRQGCLLRDGVTVVLAGRPNAGKSSLLNALAGYEAAIVTSVEGTTRDLVKEQIEIHGLPVNIIDTAGLRSSADVVEAEGVRRAQRELANADHALIIVDACTVIPEEQAALLAEIPAGIAYTVVRNKIDLCGEAPGIEAGEPALVRLSAKTGAGIEDLRRHLRELAGYRDLGEGAYTARRRHVDALRRAAAHFTAGRDALARNRAGELLAEELRLAQEALGEITGAVSADDLLGKIFGEFCIGK